MRTICAWCGVTTAVRCDHCNQILTTASVVGNGLYSSTAMLCANGLSPVLYTETAIERMQKTYTLCDACASMTHAERDAVLQRRRAEDPDIPSSQKLQETIAERQNPDPINRRIDHLPHEKKRGPKPTENERQASRQPTDAKQN